MIDIRGLNSNATKVSLGKSEKSKKNRTKSSSNSLQDDDSVALTEQTSKIQQLINQMKSAPAVDLDRVLPVQEKVAKGEYSIEYQRVANKMLDFESIY